MLRLREEVVGGALLEHLSRVHHGDPSRHVGDHAHVVRDEHERHAARALQFAQEVEDLRLDRDVERGRRLVGDQESRIAGDRHRDHHALVHAAGHLVREVLQARARRRNADLLQQLDRAMARRAAVHAEVQAQGLGQLEADGEAGIETRRRLLEDHRDLLADDRAPLALAGAEQVAPGEGEPLRAHAARRGDEPHQREHRHALAGARLADDAQHLAFVEREAHALDRTHHPRVRRELDVQVLDLDQGHGLSA